MIYYLVGTTAQDCSDFAAALGWTRIGYTRFATPAKDDIRAMTRFAEFTPAAGVAQVYRTQNYGSHQDRESFDREEGLGRLEWVS